MTTISPEPAPARTAAQSSVPTTADIDLSCRLPLVILVSSAAIWLVISSIFALIASIKFHSPSFLAEPAWLTYGRVRPVYGVSLLYGFCIQAGLAVALWITARLSMRPVVNGPLIIVGAAFWNLGLTIGVIGIFLGDSTGFETLELPAYATPLMFLGYLIVGFCAVVTFYLREQRPSVYVSQWYLLSALFWFPWAFSTAVLLLTVLPVRGVGQSVIAWWYASNLQVVWLWLVGLASAFYFLPRITRIELKNRYLALFTFWMLILFAGWSGIPARAPLPAWIPVLSTVGGVMVVLPLLTVALIFWKTLDGKLSTLMRNPQLRFIGFGAFSLMISGAMLVAVSPLNLDRVLGLTWFTPARLQLNNYGFFAMVMFGGIYYLLPLVTGVQFSPGLVRLHFWLAAVGVTLAALPLAVGGVLQGLNLQNPEIAFLDALKPTLMFLRISTIGDLLILAGHVVFLTNVVGLFLRLYRALITQRVEVATADLFKPEGAKI